MGAVRAITEGNYLRVSEGLPHGNGVGLVDLELGRLVFVGVHASREEVEEATQQVQVLSRHVGHLEYGTDPAGREGEGGKDIR